MKVVHTMTSTSQLVVDGVQQFNSSLDIRMQIRETESGEPEVI